MKFNIMTSIFAAVLLLSGCITTSGPTDSSGRSIKLTDKGNFAPTESKFNSFTFLQAGPTYKTKRVERNNGTVVSELISWDGGASEFDVEFVREAWFGNSTQDKVEDTARMQKLANEFGISDAKFINVSRPAPKMVGWVASNVDCSFGYFGKRLKTRTHYSNDRGNIDVIVKFKSCGNLSVSPEVIAAKFDEASPADLAVIAGIHR